MAHRAPSTVASGSRFRSGGRTLAWPENMRPDLIATGRFSFRREFPDAYPPEVIIRRPAYLRADGDLSGTAHINKYFPGLQPRTAFADDNKLHGMSAAEFACHLFDMEGVITTGEYLTGDMIVAAILLAVQDLTSVAWVPTGIAFQIGTSGAIGPNQESRANGKRFLVIPVLSIGDVSNHWMLAIVDKLLHAVYWYNSISSWPEEKDQESLVNYLVARNLVSTKPRIVKVQVTDQPSGWECGLLVAEHVRCFFREPSINDASGLHDWTRSVQHRDELPILGPLESPAEKLQWTIMSWTGWIRIELGHQDLSPLRYPSVPAELWEEDQKRTRAHGFLLPNCLPREFVGSQAGADTAVEAQLADMKKDWFYDQYPAEKLSSNAIAVAFDTWVGGEFGSFFDEHLSRNMTEYPYTKFRRGQPLAPPQFREPISLVKDQKSDEEDPIEGWAKRDVADLGDFTDSDWKNSDAEETSLAREGEQNADATDPDYTTALEDSSDDEDCKEEETASKDLGSENRAVDDVADKLSRASVKAPSPEPQKDQDRDEPSNLEPLDADKTGQKATRKTTGPRSEPRGTTKRAVDRKTTKSKRQSQSKRQKLPTSTAKRFGKARPTDPTTKEWQNERQIRGPRLGRPLFNRADSPDTHLEPSTIEGWRGWTAELQIRKSGKTGEDNTTL
ncbi:hypothetical protein F503_08647 [Ophiostoma piceae UAMH 11346]|uniref:Ubiquitin-like protease family profile domain-containing protein n=1 Tax=Ophiostoma piceae (strain UAMH 11346) TaxID=1262450 RepID=S3C9X3_OPHP1|nr:hypothetical protein F503_08647 [Ophiostoma piceae UAMH 11346]